MLQRADIITPIVNYLQTLESVNAVWQGGAAAWKRVDQWSDIDLMADVQDEHAEEVMQLCTIFLENQFGIDLKFEVVQGWPGVVQTFFTLKNCSAFLMVDFCIVKTSAADKFLVQEIHGEPIVHFDRKNILQPQHVNPAEWMERMQKRIPLLRNRFYIFQTLVEKELNRGNYMEAVGFYMGYTLNPLVEALRIAYAPYHYNFSFRYVQYDLPAPVVKELEPLYFIANSNDLQLKWQRAQQMFAKAIQQANTPTM